MKAEELKELADIAGINLTEEQSNELLRLHNKYDGNGMYGFAEHVLRILSLGPYSLQRPLRLGYTVETYSIEAKDDPSPGGYSKGELDDAD